MTDILGSTATKLMDELSSTNKRVQVLADKVKDNKSTVLYFLARIQEILDFTPNVSFHELIDIADWAIQASYMHGLDNQEEHINQLWIEASKRKLITQELGLRALFNILDNYFKDQNIVGVTVDDFPIVLSLSQHRIIDVLINIEFDYYYRDDGIFGGQFSDHFAEDYLKEDKAWKYFHHFVLSQIPPGWTDFNTSKISTEDIKTVESLNLIGNLGDLKTVIRLPNGYKLFGGRFDSDIHPIYDIKTLKNNLGLTYYQLGRVMQEYPGLFFKNKWENTSKTEWKVSDE